MTEYFQHYTGTIYEKIADATHSETAEDLVVYRSCKDYKVWVRPAKMFYGVVPDTVPDCYGAKIVVVPRFRRIESTEELHRLLRAYGLTPTTMDGRV